MGQDQYSPVESLHGLTAEFRNNEALAGTRGQHD
jgi:hypothetical protein